jgi:hypothetical protein
LDLTSILGFARNIGIFEPEARLFSTELRSSAGLNDKTGRAERSQSGLARKPSENNRIMESAGGGAYTVSHLPLSPLL